MRNEARRREENDLIAFSRGLWEDLKWLGFYL